MQPNIIRKPILEAFERAGEPAQEAANDSAHNEKLMTDSAVADRFAEQNKDRIRWLHDRGVWLTYTDNKWQMDESESKVMEAYKEFCFDELTQATKVTGIAEKKKAVNAAMNLQNAHKIKAVLSLVKRHTLIADTWVSYDSNPYQLQTKNGYLIDLRTGNSRNVLPTDKVLKSTGANYDPEATCPNWEKFILWAMSGDKELAAYIKRWLGYCLTGLVAEETMHLWVGQGANGKSTVREVISEVMGAYSQTAPSDLLMENKSGAASNQLARLRGVRLSYMSETRANDRIDEGMIKAAVSNEMMIARFLYKEFIQFLPSHKLILLTNHLPIVRGSDHGLWRRIRLIVFKQTVQEIDPHYRQNFLLPELSGILNWLIEGAGEYLKEGLGTCSAVDKAMMAYKADSDVFASWFDDRVKQPGGVLLRKDAWQDFEKWFESEFGEPCRGMTSRLLTRWLTDKGYENTASRGCRGFRGVELKMAA